MTTERQFGIKWIVPLGSGSPVSVQLFAQDNADTGSPLAMGHGSDATDAILDL
jgi:hypothetical protein